MVARWYHADVNGDFTEITDRVGRVDWEVREQAEEGSAALSSIVFDDPAMDWDPEPWRNWYVLEDTSEDANSMICGGWTAEQEIGREGGEWTQPLGRITSVGHTDENASWQMRVMVGADANRPAETDVERFQWLMTTNEMAWALDVTTYVQTTTPIDMDACDYRGQMLNQIADDCAQASGRNWYAWIDMIAAVRTVTVWYGHDDWAVRDSPLSLSNDQDDWDDDELEDGTSLVWPISMDTKLARDPSRMYDGVLVQYDGGSVYRDTDPRTVRRDFISPSANVKSKDKAEARALRYLAELDEQDLVVHTTVELPAAKATMIRAGMRLQFKATHLPGFDEFQWCRVLTCSVKPVAAGERYQLTLELVPGVLLHTVATGVMWNPDNGHFGSPAAQRFDWKATGDVHGPGYPDEALDLDAFAYALDGEYTVGYEVVCASAVLDFDIYFTIAWAHTGHPELTFTAVLLRNGSIVSSSVLVEPATGEFGFVSRSFTWSPTGITAVNGDVFTVGLNTSPDVDCTVPSGTGQAEYFRILDTSQVSI